MTKREKLSKINNNLIVALAEEKAKKAAAESEYYATVHRLQQGAQEMREAVYNEPDEQEEQPTVWLDGSQHSAVIVARRVFGKMPTIPAGCSFEVSVFRHDHKALGLKDETILHLSAYNGNKPSGSTWLSVDISEEDSEEEQKKKYTEWRKAVDFHFAEGKEADNE